MHFRISQAVENVPTAVKDKVMYTQSYPYIVVETRSYPREQFPGIQCTRLDLKLDRTLSRMVQTPTGFVFVCDTPQEEPGVRYSMRGVSLVHQSYFFHKVIKIRILIIEFKKLKICMWALLNKSKGTNYFVPRKRVVNI